MLAPGTSGRGAELVVARGVAYETLGLGFAYPSMESFERLSVALTHAAGLAHVLGDELAGLLIQIDSERSRTDVELAAVRHLALFGGGVACSAHETEYESDPFAKSRQLADIAGFYRAFGLETSAAHKTMPDFVGTELEFMGMLCRKEAYAHTHQWTDKEAVAADAQATFLRDHLGRWIEVFTDQLLALTVVGGAADRFYSQLARTARQFVELEMAAFGVEPRRLTRRMTLAGSNSVMTCDPRVVPTDGSSAS